MSRTKRCGFRVTEFKPKTKNPTLTESSKTAVTTDRQSRSLSVNSNWIRRATYQQLTVWVAMMLVAIQFTSMQLVVHFFITNGHLLVTAGSLFKMLAIMATFSAIYCSIAFSIGEIFYNMLKRENLLPGSAELTAHFCLFLGIMGFLYGLNWG